MNIIITPATLQEKLIFERLLQLYLYDFSEFDKDDVDEQGLFAYPALSRNWEEPDRHPFLIRVDGVLAGFLLMREGVERPGDPPRKVNTIAEFFILKKYRHGGVGEFAAGWIFDHYPGHWEIEILTSNFPAQAFWHKIVNRYSNGNFQEIKHENENYQSVIQTFSNL